MDGLPRETLADHTTLRVGGSADAWLAPVSEELLVDAIARLDAQGEPVLIVGGGSNLLVSDDGFRGTVVQIATQGREVTDLADRVQVTLAAGEQWDSFVADAVDHGWSGVEALSGIPGLVGATPIQNVGAYGQEVAQTITSVRAWDRSTRTTVALTPGECAFDYRSSRFKAEPGRWMILAVTFELAKDATGPATYAELAAALGVARGASAPVRDIRAAVLGLRRAKGMVLVDDDPDTWSAGSFFTNPIVDAAVDAGVPADCPRYPAAGGVKLSAAWLIESAGIARGFSVRSDSAAAISGRHTLALTNRGGASAADIVDLARAVQARVHDVFGIRLEPEPTLVGCSL